MKIKSQIQTPRQWRHSAYHHCHNLIMNSKWTVLSGMLTGQRDCLLICYIIATVNLSRGELSGLDQFLDRTSAVYSMLLYTAASFIEYLIHQSHFG